MNAVLKWSVLCLAWCLASSSSFAQGHDLSRDSRVAPVNCLLYKPPRATQSDYVCAPGKHYQVQAPQAELSFLTQFNVNVPYDRISKACDLTITEHLALSFDCVNAKDNWAVSVLYYHHQNREISTVEVKQLRFRTCSNANLREVFQSVINKYGNPTEVEPPGDTLLYVRRNERMRVANEPPSRGREIVVRGSVPREELKCPGHVLIFNLAPTGFDRIREAVYQDIVTKSSAGVRPKF